MNILFLSYIMDVVGSVRVPIKSLSPKSNWTVGNELGLAYLLEGRPREQ